MLKIEAKLAMKTGDKLQIPDILGEYSGNMGGVSKVTVQEEEVLQIQCSPETGTQGAPMAEWSSQEEQLITDDQLQITNTYDKAEKGGNDENSPKSKTRMMEEEGSGTRGEKNIQETTLEKGENAQDNDLSIFKMARSNIRQSERIKQQGGGDLKVANKAGFTTTHKIPEGLLKDGDKLLVEAGEQLKATAMQFHPPEAPPEDTGMVLLQ